MLSSTVGSRPVGPHPKPHRTLPALVFVSASASAASGGCLAGDASEGCCLADVGELAAAASRSRSARAPALSTAFWSASTVSCPLLSPRSAASASSTLTALATWPSVTNAPILLSAPPKPPGISRASVRTSRSALPISARSTSPEPSASMKSTSAAISALVNLGRKSSSESAIEISVRERWPSPLAS